MKRYEAEKPLLARRLRHYRRFLGRTGSATASGEPQAGRYRKRHPLDCGRTQCGLCHHEKRFGIRSVKERSADEAFQSELNQLRFRD